MMFEESYDDEITTDNEFLRRKLWIKVYTTGIAIPGAKHTGCCEIADQAVCAFDTRFNPNKEVSNNDN